jgi:hypothetical protein
MQNYSVRCKGTNRASSTLHIFLQPTPLEVADHYYADMEINGTRSFSRNRVFKYRMI